MKTMLKGAVAALAFGLTATATFGQDVTLRFQHFISNASAVPAHFMLPWSEQVAEQSAGRLEVQIYPSMQLGGAPPAIYQQIADGVIDGGWFIPGYTPGRFPSAEAFELPFMTSMSAEDSSRALWRYYEDYMAEELSGIKVLAVHVHGSGIIHTRNPTVETLEDMQGLQLRGPTRQANALLSAMGATPVGMPVPAFPEALSRGVVDGGVIPWEIVPSLRVHELATAHTEIGGDRALYNTVFIWGMNHDSYNNLPDDLRAIIDANSGLMASEWAGRAMDIGDVPGREVAAATDNALITLDDAETARWAELADPIIEAWVAEMDARGLDGQAMVSRAAELMAEETAR